MTDFEHDVMEFMGTVRENCRNLEQGQISQGERLGRLEVGLQIHKEECRTRRNGNGWKLRGYQGGTLVAIFELFRHMMGALGK